MTSTSLKTEQDAILLFFFTKIPNVILDFMKIEVLTVDFNVTVSNLVDDLS